ncbi:hypothetical protein FQR65_LT07232 [Abscondita terminalis]|nr:hypothetical protein FQR65_LT07232 [Abscondita terminalis]
MNRVIDNVFEEDETLVVLSLENNDHGFLNALKHQLIFLSFDELENLQQFTYFKMGIICYFDAQTTIDILQLWFPTVLYQANSNPRVKWFVIVPQNDISEYFLVFWRFEFLNVVVLAHYIENNDTSFQIFTGDPQDPVNNCGRNFNSANQQNCHSNLTFVFNVPRKFNGCTFRICSAYPTRTVKQTELAVSESIMKITATYLNASYEFDVGDSCPSPVKIINSFLRFHLLYSQNTIIFYSSNPVWAVPKPKKIHPFTTITLIFKNTVWVLILLSIILTSLFLWLLIKYESCKHDFLLILLEIWQITLFGSINKLPWQWTLRFVIISYILYCIHIQAVFASKIIELLTVPQYERGIQNVRELSESNLSIIVSDELKIMFFDQFNLKYDNVSNNINRLLYSTGNRDIVATFLDCLKTDIGCAAFFIGDEDHFNDSISEVAHLISENSVVGSINYVFFTLKHSCMFESLNQVVNTLVETGMNDYFIKKYGSQYRVFSNNTDTKTILTMGHLHIVFAFWAIEQHTNEELYACVNRVIDNVFAEDETLVVLSFKSNGHSFLKGLKHQLIFLLFDELKNLQQPTYFNMGIICYFDAQTNISILKLWFRTLLFGMNSNSRMGPIGSITIDSAYDCAESTLNDKFSFHLYLKTDPQKAKYVEMELENSIPVDVDLKYDIEVFKWDSSGWKSVLKRKGNVCNDLKQYLGDLFIKVTQATVPSISPTCPIPPGKYKIEKIQAGAKDLKIPIIYYGQLKLITKLLIENEIVFCQVSEALSQSLI